MYLLLTVILLVCTNTCLELFEIGLQAMVGQTNVLPNILGALPVDLQFHAAVQLQLPWVSVSFFIKWKWSDLLKVKPWVLICVGTLITATTLDVLATKTDDIQYMQGQFISQWMRQLATIR